MRVAPLRTATKEEYTDPIVQHWTHDAEQAREDLKDAILLDPCIQRFDHRKLVVLRIDFSSMDLATFCYSLEMKRLQAKQRRIIGPVKGSPS